MRAYSAAITVNMGARPDAALGGFESRTTPADVLAGGQAKIGRPNEFGAPVPEKKGLMGLLKDWSGAAKKERRMARLAVGVDGQMIGNAEAMWSQTFGPVEVSGQTRTPSSKFSPLT